MTIAEFLAEYSSAGSGAFRNGQVRGIGSDDMRAFATAISSLGSSLVVSSSLSRSMAAGSAIEIFTGSNDGVWTFPPISGNTEKKKVIKNKTAFNLTIDSSGSNEIWDFEEADSRVIGPGESRTYINDGTHWTQI